MDFKATYHTDVGIRKKTNQDSLALKIINTPRGQVAFGIVCDGMGGLEKGELASKEVIMAFCKWFDVEFSKDFVEGKVSYESLKADWNDIIQTQNIRLAEFGQSNSLMLGTTISAILIFEGMYYTVHVGDSRIYELTNVSKQITMDQTFVAREMAAGRLSMEQAKIDPRRSILLQCVGASQVVEPEFQIGEAKNNAVYMLCSDGFRHQISDQEVLEKIGPQVVDSEEEMKNGCAYLTEVVKDRKETDNISVAIIKTI